MADNCIETINALGAAGSQYIEQEADTDLILQEDGDLILAEDSTATVVPIIMQNLDQFNGGTICAL